MKSIKSFKKTFQGKFIILSGLVLFGLGGLPVVSKAISIDFRNPPIITNDPNLDSLHNPITESIIRKFVHQEFGQDYSNLTKAYFILWSISSPSDINFGYPTTLVENMNFLNIVRNSPRYFLNKPNLDLNPNSIVPYTEQGLSIMAAWDLFIKEYPQLKDNPKYLNQLSQISFIILILDSGKIWRKCHHSYTEREKSSFRKNSHQFSNLLSEISELIKYNESFSEEKKINGPSILSQFQFAKPDFLISTRSIIDTQTVKGDSSLISNYTLLPSAKKIQTYYLPIWNLYRDYIQFLLDNRRKVDPISLEAKFQEFDRYWSKLSNSTNHKNSASKIDLQKLYLKYRDLNFREE